MNHKAFWAVLLGILVLLHFAKYVARALDHTRNRDKWLEFGSFFEALNFAICIIMLLITK